MNPYKATEDPDDRPWFSGWPPWFRRTRQVVLPIIAILAVANAIMLVRGNQTFGVKWTLRDWLEFVLKGTVP